MANRTGNYCAFYVAEPFNQNNLGLYKLTVHFVSDFG